MLLEFLIPLLQCLQIVGDIKAARDALVELTSRLRSYLYKEPFQKDTSPPVSLGLEESSSNNNVAAREVHSGIDPSSTAYQNVQPFGTAQLLKVTCFLIFILLSGRGSFFFSKRPLVRHFEWRYFLFLDAKL